MAKRGRKRKSTKRKSSKPKSNHVPLNILEKRLAKLNRVVKKRGGDSF